MGYSLLNQFQGALWGAIVGEFIAQTWPHPPSGCPSRGLVFDRPLVLPLTAVLLTGVESLCDRGDLDLADWQRLTLPDQAMPPLALAIPIALFFHEDDRLLYRKLEQLWQVQVFSLECRAAILILSQTIAWFLRRQMSLTDLIPRLINRLRETDLAATTVLEQLGLVQRLLTQAAGIETAIVAMGSRSPEVTAMIPIFYSFLRTPQDYRLALCQTAQISIYQSNLCTITGAVAGAYNGSVCLPSNWSHALNSRMEPIPSPLSTLSHPFRLESHADQLAAQLLAVWSGQYPLAPFIHRADQTATAAPGVIRPR
ncbi:hypothetical protein BST81_03805 [Leptolyngbya sp. 'hensonii']|uniref:ADP-ribosylglycohydrolase family protein n=1 Tax=Leptolyngbya sp. 'hensonii' TaxID=1922337 RepID=UPI00095017BF|nr:ADP-ribosylglycohydrolase family protein [Leptolyngbya sp. 'hensonii']OLP19677.1 hypothetical protein BST81_03805 [Leptolyngbya sp. 'hensonii']